MYKFEIHLHTNSCSACAVSSPCEMLDAAKEHGYSGIVITNHFYHGNTRVDRNLDWKEFVGAYAEDYYKAKEYGEKLGIKVFFGLEEGFAPGKEMLIYGLSPELIAEHPEFIMMSAAEKSEFVHSHGGLTVCAHPFRNRQYIPEPDKTPDTALFDAIECFNYFNAPEENVKAFLFAENNNMLKTSGGDLHHEKDFGGAGIAFNQKIETYEQFLENLKSGNYKLLNPFEI